MLRSIGKQLGQFLGVASKEEPSVAPESVLAAQQEGLRQELSQFNRSLAASTQFCAVLKGQIQELESRQRALLRALETEARAGGSPSAGGELALQCHQLDGDLAELRVQLEQAEATAATLTAARDTAITGARQRIEALKGSLSQERLRQALTEAREPRRKPGSHPPGSAD